MVALFRLTIQGFFCCIIFQKKTEAAETVTTVNAVTATSLSALVSADRRVPPLLPKKCGKQDRAFIGQDTTSAISRPTILL